MGDISMISLQYRTSRVTTAGRLVWITGILPEIGRVGLGRRTLKGIDADQLPICCGDYHGTVVPSFSLAAFRKAHCAAIASCTAIPTDLKNVI